MIDAKKLRNAQSALLKFAALGCLVANYGRLNLDKEIQENLRSNASTSIRHEKKDNWLGYQANAWTALYGFRQGFFYYFGMAIFYLHLSGRKGKLNAIELAGLVNQIIFHLHSIYEFRGLSQKVSGVFAVLVGAGAACGYLAN